MNAGVLAAALRIRTLQARLAAQALADAGRAAAAERGREEAGRQRLRAEVQAWHAGSHAPDSGWLSASLAEAARVREETRRAEQAVVAARRDNARAMLDQEVVEAAFARARTAAAARSAQREQDECLDAGRARCFVQA